MMIKLHLIGAESITLDIYSFTFIKVRQKCYKVAILELQKIIYTYTVPYRPPFTAS